MKTCIIVPCFNEEKRLDLNAFNAFTFENENIHFCFVNDGSNDDTEHILKQLALNNNKIEYINNPVNSGKAESVRNGIQYNIDSFDYLAFLDADLATPLYEMNRLILHLENGNHNAVIGSRILKLGAKIERRFKRHLLGRLFATVIDNLFKIAAYDTQCGAKIFKNDLAKKIFNTPFVTKWIFDVELLIRIRNLNLLDTVYELPLNCWKDIAGSKIRLKDTISLPLEIYKLYKKYK